MNSASLPIFVDGVLPAGLERGRALEDHALVERDTEEHALEPEAPAVARRPRCAVRAGALVEPPADAAVAHAGTDRFECLGVDTETGAERRHAEQREDGGGGEAAFGQREQVQEALHHRVPGAGVAVGDAERDVARVVPRLREHGVDQPGVGADVGRHHRDVARLQPGQRGKQREQLVLQRFDLAQRAVRLGEHQARIGRGQRARRLRCLQQQDVALQLAQHAARNGFAEALAKLAAVAVEQQQEAVAPQRAPRGQQRVAGLGVRGTFGRQQLPARTGTLADDVVPVLAAGIELEQVHVGARCQRRERLDEHGRQRPQPEADHPLGQRDRQRRAAAEARDQAVEARGAVRAGGMRRPDLPHQRAPQRGLPFVARERAVAGGRAGLPRQQPARAVQQVLVEQRGEASAQRVQAPLRRDGVEVAAHRVEGGLVEQPGQHAHQPYRELLLAPGGCARRVRIAQYCCGQRIQEHRGRVVAQVRRHAQPCRDALPQPLGHADVRHDQPLRHQRRRRRGSEQRAGRIAQRLHVVAVVLIEQAPSSWAGGSP